MVIRSPEVANENGLIASLDVGLIWPKNRLHTTTYISSFSFLDVHTCISVLPAVPSSSKSNQRVKCHRHIKYKQCGSTFKRQK